MFTTRMTQLPTCAPSPRLSRRLCRSCRDGAPRVWPLLHGCVWRQRCQGNSNLSLGLNSAIQTSVLGLSWRLFRDDHENLAAENDNTTQHSDCFTLKWTILRRGKFSGPPWDVGVMSLCEVPTSLSLTTTLIAWECTCSSFECSTVFDVLGLGWLDS